MALVKEEGLNIFCTLQLFRNEIQNSCRIFGMKSKIVVFLINISRL
jgi:hypothetical protein